jgi:hypothetical protein
MAAKPLRMADNPMSQFKIGDKVKVGKRIDLASPLKLNKIYTITYMTEECFYVKEFNSGWYKWRFVLAEKHGLAKFVELQEALGVTNEL